MPTIELDSPNDEVLINQENFIDYAMQRGFGDIHFKVCEKSGLQSIVAIHSTKLGPALGGCRFIEYPNTFSALYDVMRLGRGMSYKAALVGLPLGGGKGVIIKPKGSFNRRELFLQFGEFVDSLGGRYITAVDSGTTLEDMDTLHEKTEYVASLSKQNGEPSYCTATGVLKGIEAAVKFKLGKDTLEGLHIAIQGIGKVGYSLATYLHEMGAKLTVSDVNNAACEKAKIELNATVVDSDQIHRVDCDVFSPCALGGTINDTTIHELNTSIVAGAANNQLARAYHGHILHENGILYATDYVINAGGLIYASSLYHQTKPSIASKQVENIYHSLLAIFERSKTENRPCSEIADKIAREKLS
jgi:leucine dehydrogenase